MTVPLGEDVTDEKGVAESRDLSRRLRGEQLTHGYEGKSGSVLQLVTTGHTRSQMSDSALAVRHPFRKSSGSSNIVRRRYMQFCPQKQRREDYEESHQIKFQNI